MPKRKQHSTGATHYSVNVSSLTHPNLIPLPLTQHFKTREHSLKIAGVMHLAVGSHFVDLLACICFVTRIPEHVHLNENRLHSNQLAETPVLLLPECPLAQMRIRLQNVAIAPLAAIVVIVMAEPHSTDSKTTHWAVFVTG